MKSAKSAFSVVALAVSTATTASIACSSTTEQPDTDSSETGGTTTTTGSGGTPSRAGSGGRSNSGGISNNGGGRAPSSAGSGATPITAGSGGDGGDGGDGAEQPTAGSGGASGGAGNEPPVEPEPLTFVSKVRSVASGGVEREFILALPDPMPPNTALPLVFSLHGDGGAGKGMRAALPLEAQATSGAVFVYPSAPGGTFEYFTGAGRSREAQFVLDVIETLEAELDIDDTRVFITGMSGGATMANALACRLGPETVRGVGIHSGTLFPSKDALGVPDFEYTANGGVSCPLPASVIIWGRADRTAGVTFSEGESTRSTYTATQECEASTKAWNGDSCVAYDGCSRPVVWCAIPELGHSIWPGAAQAIWQFFSELPAR